MRKLDGRTRLVKKARSHNIYFVKHFLPGIVVALVFIIIFMVLKAKNPGNRAYKYAVALALVGSFLLFWVNGAVGIIGAADNDSNLIFFGVLAVGGIGAIIARFRPREMARALICTAIAHLLAGSIALISGWGSSGALWPWDILLSTIFFAAVFVGSARLFSKAAGANAQENTNLQG